MHASQTTLNLEKKSHKFIASNLLTHHKWKRGICELAQSGNCDLSANRLIFSNIFVI